MKNTAKKWGIIGVLGAVLIMISYFTLSANQITKSISMVDMVIEEKSHYIDPGNYFEMWVIGYNGNESEENRDRYKIFIEDSMVYNLIKEGEKYNITASSFREDEEYGHVYQLSQISNQEMYQLAGKGRIK
ncbi:hypothetical protein J2Z40_003492 [Cytobacillus eiseniae]|uniref:YxeA family protein n=1 Tax=Cytobacillus eiseniae TaxID=762947 RepID=A0ABS4RKN3_9BACI|nr:hypothetical protein [Cytobacillus eiseniae]MBP2242910.1 hypothetical protein [Cytobacillus eiseniae]